MLLFATCERVKWLSPANFNQPYLKNDIEYDFYILHVFIFTDITPPTLEAMRKTSLLLDEGVRRKMALWYKQKRLKEGNIDLRAAQHWCLEYIDGHDQCYSHIIWWISTFTYTLSCLHKHAILLDQMISMKMMRIMKSQELRIQAMENLGFSGLFIYSFILIHLYYLALISV